MRVSYGHNLIAGARRRQRRLRRRTETGNGTAMGWEDGERGVECYRHWPSGDRVAYKHNAATGDGVDDAASSDPSHTIDNASRRRRRQQGHDATSASASAPAPVTATGIGTATATATGNWQLALATGCGQWAPPSGGQPAIKSHKAKWEIR